MGLEPAFAQNNVAWPLAGPFVLPLEPNDPDFTIPHGSLQSSLRDTPEKNYIADVSGELTTIPAEPLVIRTRQGEPGRKWKAAVVLSLVLHAAAAMAFLATAEDPVLIEGADQSGVMLLGNAPEDQSAAGDITKAPPETTKVTLVTMLDPKLVKTVEAQTVASIQTTQPVESTEAETPAMATLEPLWEAPDRPDSTPDRVRPVLDEPATAATLDPLPEILTFDPVQPVEDDNSVQKPARQSTTPVEATEAVPAEAAPEKAAPVETFEKVPAEAEPQQTPAGKKPQPTKPGKAEPAKKPAKKAQKAEARKKPEKVIAKQVRSGSGGQNEADARRGAAEGRTGGKTTTRSQGGKSEVGNASVSNYPGKVAAKLQRAVRGISSSARAKARNDVQVSFVIDANGGVGGIRIARSSGSPELDAAALAIIRRAAPFPPIPPDAGRSSWAFALPLGLAR